MLRWNWGRVIIYPYLLGFLRCHLSPWGVVWCGPPVWGSDLCGWGSCCRTIWVPGCWDWRAWWNYAQDRHNLWNSWWVSPLGCPYIQSRNEAPGKPFSSSSPKLQELLWVEFIASGYGTPGSYPPIPTLLQSCWESVAGFLSWAK